MPFTIVPITGFTTDLPLVHIGGSITQGTHVSAALRYVDMIGRYVGLNTYYHITNFNSGIGGHNSWMDLVRMGTDLTAHAPSLVVFDCAVNNGATDTDKATAEAVIRRIRTDLPNAFIVLVYFGTYPQWSTNVTTNAAAANITYLKLLAANYDCAEVDVDAALRAAVTAGTFTVQQYTDDGPHPIAAGNTFVYNQLLPEILKYYPLPATPQWTQDLDDYEYLYDNGDYENTPIIRTGIDNDGETGTWATVSTTQRRSSEANATIAWTGTCQSFGLDHALTGSVAYDVDGGGYTTINLAAQPISNLLIWSGVRASHTITFKVISGTVTILRFLAV